MSPLDALVRPATVQDAAGIAAVHIASWQDAYRGQLPDTYLDGMSTPPARARRTQGWADIVSGGSAVLVAEDAAGQVTGFASTGASRDQDAAAGTGELYAIYVHPRTWEAESDTPCTRAPSRG